MKREAGIMKLYPGMKEEYKKRHSEIWPELTAEIKSQGACNYSIFLDEATNQLFSYLEVTDEKAWSERGASQITKKWWDYMKDIMETNPDNSPVFIPIEEVFHLN